MTILSAHNVPVSAMHRIWSDYKSYRFAAPIRRIASFSTSNTIIDVLRNRAGIIRADWDTSFSFGSITIAILRKNGRA